MRRTSFARWPCPIARSADLLGDAWTLLVLREAYYGETRFDGFVESLGVARSTLADRLRRLVDAGLLSMRPYQSDPVRHEYLPTEKGRDFFPVLAALATWGDRWTSDEAGPPVLLRHESCGHDLRAEVVCSSCGGSLAPQDVTARPGPGYPEHLRGEPAALRRFGPAG